MMRIAELGLAFALAVSLSTPALAASDKGSHNSALPAQATYQGKKITLTYRNLSVTLDSEESHDPQVCQMSTDNAPSSQAANAQSPACTAVVAKIRTDQKVALVTALAPVHGFVSITSSDLTVAVRRLDSGTSSPQVVFTGYSGGAHCCTWTRVATLGDEGHWRLVDAGETDGGGYGFIRLADDDTEVLVGVDDSFDYQFSDYGSAFPPTRILKLSGTTLKNVTRDIRYRPFVVREVREMGARARENGYLHSNGYLAGWVAQNAMVGQFGEAWRAMLASYDHSATDGLAECHVDKRVWVKDGLGDRVCPTSQEYIIPFPEALALYLVRHGYISSEQSKDVGYDTVQLEADRKQKIAAATAEYQRQVDSPPVDSAQPPSLGQQPPAFQQGIADRQAWENWFNRLSGNYRSGAEFWAGQRSNPHPGPCYGANGQDLGDWTAGCVAALQRLALPDARRKTEPDYRRGWNSPPATSTAGPTATSTAPAPPSVPATTSAPTMPPTAAPLSGASRASPHPLETRSGIPIEKDSVLIDYSPETLDLIDRMVQVVRANGYHCDSISAFHPYILSRGLELTCNRFAYSYDFEDKGRGLEFRPPQ